MDSALAVDLKSLPHVRAIEGTLPDALDQVSSASLDIVLCISVLEHLWDPLAVLKQCLRIVRPEGTCLFNVPSWRGKEFLEFSAFRLGLSPKGEMDDHKAYYDVKDFWPLLVRRILAEPDPLLLPQVRPQHFRSLQAANDARFPLNFIVGGAGFIGSHFTDRLLSDGSIKAVTLYDNFSSGREWHYEHHRHDERLCVIRGDVKDVEALTASMQGHDVVIHLASNPDIARAVTEPEIDFQEGTLLTNNVVEAMRRSKTPMILYASGSGVYGDLGDKEVNEEYGPLLPISTRRQQALGRGVDRRLLPHVRSDGAGLQIRQRRWPEADARSRF